MTGDILLKPAKLIVWDCGPSGCGLVSSCSFPSLRKAFAAASDISQRVYFPDGRWRLGVASSRAALVWPAKLLTLRAPGLGGRACVPTPSSRRDLQCGQSLGQLA